MQSIAQSPGSPHRWLAVSAPEEIEFLVKESEVLTGKPGRTLSSQAQTGSPTACSGTLQASRSNAWTRKGKR